MLPELRGTHISWARIRKDERQVSGIEATKKSTFEGMVIYVLFYRQTGLVPWRPLDQVWTATRMYTGEQMQ